MTCPVAGCRRSFPRRWPSPKLRLRRFHRESSSNWPSTNRHTLSLSPQRPVPISSCNLFSEHWTKFTAPFSVLSFLSHSASPADCYFLAPRFPRILFPRDFPPPPLTAIRSLTSFEFSFANSRKKGTKTKRNRFLLPEKRKRKGKTLRDYCFLLVIVESRRELAPKIQSSPVSRSVFDDVVGLVVLRFYIITHTRPRPLRILVFRRLR